MPETKYQAQ